MINIIVAERENHVEIEGKVFPIGNRESIVKMIQEVLDKAHYGGEAICLEERNFEGYYKEVKRW